MNSSNTTQHKIEKITYIVETSCSPTSKETLETKIEKLILKEIQKTSS